MRVSVKHKFVFISTPKVCTHSIYQVLEEHYFEGLWRDGLHVNQIPARFRNYFRWTVCRNPYSRAASLWWSACRLHPPDIYGFRRGCGAADDFARFIEWLSRTDSEDRHELMQNQTEWLKPCELITALHMESLVLSVHALPFWKPEIVIPRLNTTEGKIAAQSKEEGKVIERPPLRELCQDWKVRAAVMRWAGEDFERFGYSTNLEECEA